MGGGSIGGDGVWALQMFLDQPIRRSQSIGTYKGETPGGRPSSPRPKLGATRQRGGTWLGRLVPHQKRRQKRPASSEPALPLPICKCCGALLTRETDRLRRRAAYCPELLSSSAKGTRTRIARDLPASGKRESLGVADSPFRRAREQRQQSNALRRAEDPRVGSSTSNSTAPPHRWCNRWHRAGAGPTHVGRCLDRR